MPLRRNWPQNFDSNKRNATFWGLKMGIWSPTKMAHGCSQGCTTCGSLAARLRENGERMRKWRENGESIRKWREIRSLHFLISFYSSPLYPFPLSKLCHFTSYVLCVVKEVLWHMHTVIIFMRSFLIHYRESLWRAVFIILGIEVIVFIIFLCW